MSRKALQRQESPELTPEQTAMARGWYGYGRWSAPFWFIGIEPGGDELDACVRLWNELGRGELLDIAVHHEEHAKDWFSDKATHPQATWQKLIWLLLAYKGLDATPQAVLEYQKRHLGRADEETALIELSSLPARDGRVDVPRRVFREERIENIRRRLLEYAPHFVVFYSPDPAYIEAWNRIVGQPLEKDRAIALRETACVVTNHPNGEWSKQYWIETGRTLRRMKGD